MDSIDLYDDLIISDELTERERELLEENESLKVTYIPTFIKGLYTQSNRLCRTTQFSQIASILFFVVLHLKVSYNIIFTNIYQTENIPLLASNYIHTLIGTIRPVWHSDNGRVSVTLRKGSVTWSQSCDFWIHSCNAGSLDSLRKHKNEDFYSWTSLGFLKCCVVTHNRKIGSTLCKILPFIVRLRRGYLALSQAFLNILKSFSFFVDILILLVTPKSRFCPHKSSQNDLKF
jgi:hypothetical protein